MNDEVQEMTPEEYERAKARWDKRLEEERSSKKKDSDTSDASVEKPK